MSTKRISDAAGWIYAATKNDQGQRLCRWCNGVVPPPRRSFCSDECVHQHKLRTNPGYVRDVVFARDKGICAVCGLDTIALKAEYNQFIKDLKTRGLGYFRYNDEITDWLEQHGIPQHRMTFWDADHIVPVSEGGGECDESNYRTLCLPCHKKATGELRQRLSKPKGKGRAS